MRSESAQVGARFKDGDPLAAEVVRNRVRRTLAFRGYAIPSEERRDLAQTVMAQLWEATQLPGFDPAAGFWGFVELVVARRCIDWRRTRRTEVPLDPTVLGADAAAGPLDSALRRERETLMREVVASLPQPCQELIRLRLERNMTYAAAAEVLGVAEGAVRVRMHRCIQRAQGILQRLRGPKEPL